MTTASAATFVSERRLELSALDIFGKKPRGAENCEDFNSVFASSIDNAIAVSNQLTKVRLVDFRNDPTSIRVVFEQVDILYKTLGDHSAITRRVAAMNSSIDSISLRASADHRTGVFGTGSASGE